MLVASSVVLGAWWKCDPDCPSGGDYSGIVVQSMYITAPLLIGAGTSSLTWSLTYSRVRPSRVELSPTLGGLHLRF